MSIIKGYFMDIYFYSRNQKSWRETKLFIFSQLLSSDCYFYNLIKFKLSWLALTKHYILISFRKILEAKEAKTYSEWCGGGSWNRNRKISLEHIRHKSAFHTKQKLKIIICDKSAFQTKQKLKIIIRCILKF